jgi:hypothetical protein
MKPQPEIYGIGPALEAALRIYFECARRTGRTTMLLDLVESGDRVIFAESQDARRFGVMARQKGLVVGSTVVNPVNPNELFGMKPSEGRTWFDHTWVEWFYAAEVIRMGRQISEWQACLSGENRPDPGTRSMRMPDDGTLHPLQAAAMLAGRNDIKQVFGVAPQNFEDEKP